MQSTFYNKTRQKTHMETIPTTLAALAAMASVSQAAVYVNFDGRDDAGTGGGPATGAPFGIDSSQWTNTGNLASSPGMSVGDASTVEWSSGNTWSDDNPPSTDDESVYGGYLDDGGTGSTAPTVIFTGLTAEFGGAAYNVTLYGFSDSPDNTVGTYDIGGTSVDAVASPSTGDLTGNYGIATLNGVTGDSLTIAGFNTDSSRDRRETISGITITPVPEPSGVALLGLGGLGFLMRRRR